MEAVVYYILALLAFTAVGVESQCTENATRVVWGDGPWEGNVQVCIGGVWGWVCHNSWGTPDAQVVCRQLGFSTDGAIYRYWSYYGLGNASTPIHLDRVNCAGSELKLMSCSRSIGIGLSNCGYNQIGGVVCPKGGTCTNGAIRKIRNNNGTPYRGGGRVEVCSGNQWGTVCDDYFDSNEARVACRQLGYSDQKWGYSCCARYYGQGYGSIFLDNLHCNGGQSSLFSCPHNGVGNHNCGHNEDAGVNCYGKTTPSSCTNGDVKLWRPSDGPEYFGLALYCKNNVWAGVCDDSFTCHTARLFCQKLGFPGAMGTRSEGYWGLFYYSNTGVDHYAWSCNSGHKTLSSCSYSYHSNCYHYHDQFGIICYPKHQGNDCSNGDVKLVDGTDSSNGRVMYCFEGYWAPLCYISTSTASAICQTIGFTSPYALVYNDERYGTSEQRSGLNYINCPTGATNITSQCSPVYKTWSGGCYISLSKCSREMGIQCFNASQSGCVDGSIRLVDGVLQQEGRLEVCTYGIWGTICQSNWNPIDAYIACNQLGYPGTSPTSYYNSKFGVVNKPTAYNNVRCVGWETAFSQCSKDVYPAGSCLLSQTVGIVCKEGCDDGAVRLLGGGFENEGTIQVCYGNLWGLVSDNTWDENDARVVCRQLGYAGGSTVAVLGSRYGKPNNTIHLRNVACVGNEINLDDCTKTRLSLTSGTQQLASTSVAGVDCEYDTPTDPPCIPQPNHYEAPGSDCSPNGQVRLQGGDQAGSGRLEYCYNGYWSPFCNMDPKVAMVACRDLGFTSYSWGSVLENGEFASSLNISLFKRLNCTGSETSLSQCTPITNVTCTPFCRYNLGLRCFNPTECTTDGAVRLADGIIDNEGRVEVCVNGVWGTVCDQGWDRTDAHVVCKQLGHPELEPVVFTNSLFGAGKYPIVYSNTACGGYEASLTDCDKQTYPQSNCSRDNVAGLLCGYDCQNGDVRLSGGTTANEGNVEICFNNLWGTVSESGWSDTEAGILCQQLGYVKEGSQAYSEFNKPSLTVHFGDFACTGEESSITHCSYTTYSLAQGKDLIQQAQVVGGVKCNRCPISAPEASDDGCTSGELRLTGGIESGVQEGKLQYCVDGTWSDFCYLGANEALVACRQLGLADIDVAVVFTDGRFGSGSTTSFFTNFNCSGTTGQFIDCQLDSCPSSCPQALGLRCYEETNCAEGEVRLMGGAFETEGRVEVCHNGIWGSICSTGFDATDAHVICKEVGIGQSEPTVYNNSHFGDGDVAIVYSDLKCNGYERSIVDCNPKEYGSFECSRSSVVGVMCQDQCTNGDIQLFSNRNTTMAGTILICSDNTWGLIADNEWDKQNAQVTCKQLGYVNGGEPVTGSLYGKPNRTILYNSVSCAGTESGVIDCPSDPLTPADGRAIYPNVNVAGVSCMENTTSPPTDFLSKNVPTSGAVAGLVIALIVIVISAVVTVILIVYVIVKKREMGKATVMHSSRVMMSGIENPGVRYGEEDEDEYDTANKEEYLKHMSR